MTPHKQLIKHDPDNGFFGDCYRTCIASMLNMKPGDVPHFLGTDGMSQNAKATEWLGQFGLALAAFYYEGHATADNVISACAQLSPGVPMILSGASRIGSNHSVVIMDGEIASDPSDNGIVGPCDDGYFWVEVITVANNWRRP